ncbi:putative SH3-binding, glutamic acid-rich protein [Trypanosoma cruzi]|nr:putative SH3-binding, glutamic acid-rich protein [Trypanosoma cruzi]
MRSAGVDSSATASTVSAARTTTTTTSQPLPPTKVLRDRGIIDFRYPSEKRAARQLQLAFPDADAQLVAELALLVSARRQTIEDALDLLQRREESGKNAPSKFIQRIPAVRVEEGKPKQSWSYKKVGETPEKNDGVQKSGEVPPNGRGAPHETSAEKTAVVVPAVPKTTTRANAPTQRRASGSTQPSETRSGGLNAGTLAKDSAQSSHNSSHASPPLSSATTTRTTNHTSATARHTAKAVLFVTTMTCDRRVRDHCRQIETLLYLKRIQYVSVNVADDPFTQRRLREMYAASTGRNVMPPTPAFFIGDHFIGDYEVLQELEDDGKLMETLCQCGYRTPQGSNKEGDGTEQGDSC